MEPDWIELFYFDLQKTSTKIRRNKQTLFREIGVELTTDQWMILYVLSRYPDGLNSAELSEEVCKEPAAISRMIKLLEAKNWIHRVASETDKRVFHIKLTDLGESLILSLARQTKSLYQTHLNTLTQEEKEVFQRALKKIANQSC